MTTTQVNNYDISILKTLLEGWRKTKGAWGTFLGGAVLLMLLPMLFIDLPRMFFAVQGEAFFLVYSSFFYFCMLPLYVGFFILGVQWVAGEPIAIRMLFHYFRWEQVKKILWIALFYILRVILPILAVLALLFAIEAILLQTQWIDPKVSERDVTILLAFVFLFGFYWTMRYIMVIPLVFREKKSPWSAMGIAARTFDRRWFKLLTLFSTEYLIVLLFCMLGALIGVMVIFNLYSATDWTFLGIRLIAGDALVWGQFSTVLIYSSSLFSTLLAPWSLTIYGLVYRTMFENK